MKVISDNDVVEKTDGSGDKLVLRIAPYQSDIIAVAELEKDAAFKELDNLKMIGVIDKDLSVMELAQQAEKEDADAFKKAQERNKEKVDSPEVAKRRFQALAVKLVIGGKDIGGKEVLSVYEKMDPESIAWVNAQVKDVWNAAMPSDEEKNSEGADAQMPSSTTISSTEESPSRVPQDCSTD